MPQLCPEESAGFQKLIAVSIVLYRCSWAIFGSGASLANATSVYHILEMPRIISLALVREKVVGCFSSAAIF